MMRGMSLACAAGLGSLLCLVLSSLHSIIYGATMFFRIGASIVLSILVISSTSKALLKLVLENSSSATVSDNLMSSV
eukprot:4435680-Amphidinium_carterae.1